MKVVLATGVPELDSAIEDRVKKAEFTGSVLYKEAVVDVVDRKKPDVIILSELLEGVLPMRELILTLRTRFPEVRIIYILKEDNKREKAFLYHWMIFDVFTGAFTVPELEESLSYPKEFKDVHHEMGELKKYQKETVGVFEDDDGDATTGLDASHYNPIEGPEAGTNTLYQQVVAFWSVLDQSGKTFSVVNTALALAGRKELKILLLDFNIDNPNVNLYFSFVDPDRNLGAMVEDIENGAAVTKDNFNDYLIQHPVYHNLKILPGFILKMKSRDPKFFYSVFESIIAAAEQSNYSTILVDLPSGVDSEFAVNILKRSTRILLHISETPGSLNAVHRFFDNEYGPFVEKLIGKNKIIPVLTHSHDDTSANFRRAIEAFFEFRVGAIIDYNDDIRISSYKGVPILSKKTNEDIYDTFVNISNLIHKNIFKKPVVRGSAKKKANANKSKNAGGGLSGLFGFKKNPKK